MVALAEVIKRAVGLVPSLDDYLVDKLPADVLYRQQSVADILSADRKAGHAVINMRRQDTYTEVFALACILGELALVVEEVREKRRHILARIVNLEPRGLV